MLIASKAIKRLLFMLAMFAIIFIAHHSMVYFHEWVHGTAAWLTGYKSHPFAIHYGENWFTLWDIDEAVPYRQILADGRPLVMAFIAILPILCQMLTFVLGLYLLKRSTNQQRRWLFAFLYWFTFFNLAEVYAYIPIRTFAPKDDIYNFLFASEISPWAIAIPGTLFVTWGIYRMLTIEVTRACYRLGIFSKAGRLFFLLSTVFLFFGYYGGIGSWMPDPISQMLTKISWFMAFISLIALYFRYRLRPQSD